LVESTNHALKQHTGEGSSIKTINQSQSVSGLTTAQFLLDSALVPNGKGEPELTRIGDVLYQGLGKPADLGELPAVRLSIASSFGERSTRTGLWRWFFE